MMSQGRRTPPEKPSNRHNSHHQDLHSAIADGGFSTFALEDRTDNKYFQRSLWVALVVHGLLLVLNFPELSAPKAEEPPEKNKIFVMEVPRFKPPEVQPEREKPKERAKKVPIPDPTPEEPEPLRLDEPEVLVDLPVPVDIGFAIPEAPPEPEPTGPIHLTHEITRPVKTHYPSPQYTEIARKARIEGTVILQSVIDTDGRVVDVKLLKGLSMGLSEKAIEAVQEWRFEPALLRGKPVSVYYTLTVHFALN